MTKSRRLKLTMAFAAADFIFGFAAYCISPENVASLGAYLAATQIPLIAYLWAETKRKSE